VCFPCRGLALWPVPEHDGCCQGDCGGDYDDVDAWHGFCESCEDGWSCWDEQCVRGWHVDQHEWGCDVEITRPKVRV
jgi:hypothetical protein